MMALPGDIRPARRPYVASIDGKEVARGATFGAAKNAVRRMRGHAAVTDERSGRRWERVGTRWLEDVTARRIAAPARPTRAPARGAPILHAHFAAKEDEE